MRHRAFRLLAAASLLLAAHADVRPRYGGTLRIETRGALVSYDPTLPPSFDASDVLRERLAFLVFDRLVVLDAAGRPRPALATGWQPDPDLRRWTFEMRPNVKLHDGNLLAARLVVASLAAANPSWRVNLQSGSGGESVTIVSPDPQAYLPLQLASARNSILARGADGALIGSGPFRMQEWQSGRHATLVANQDYWGGRPFLESVEIMMGRPTAEQALDYRLERADIVEVSPEQARRAAQGGERVDVSSPIDVLGILMPAGATSAELHLLQAVSFALDRAAIQAVILQRQGEAAGGVLPQWMSGYAFLFRTKAELDHARQERAAAGVTKALVLAFDGGDPLQRAVADRVAVNARDAGVVVQPFAESATLRAPAAAARIVTLHLASANAPLALSAAAAALGRPDSSPGAGPIDSEALYSAERALLAESRFVPIVACGEAFAVAPNVRNWQTHRDGSWALADVFLREAP